MEGQYYIASYSNFEINQDDRPLYLPTLWNEYNQVIPPSNERPENSVMTVFDGEAKNDINFLLTPAALLVVTDNENFGKAFFEMFLIDNDDIFFNAIISENTIISGNNAVRSNTFYQYLPIGDYRFYVGSESDFYGSENFVNYLYGAGNCYSCRLELLAGKGEVVSLNRFDKKVIDINRNQGASISGQLTFDQSTNDTEFYSYVTLDTKHITISL